jgi:lysozyme
MRTLTKHGTQIVTHFESFTKNAYKCPGGTWTIGYGHTSGVKEGDKLPDHKTGVRLLKQDLNNAANVVRKNFAQTPLTQAQFDALTSLAFNCPSALKQGDSRFAKHVALAIPKINTERDPDKKLAMEKRLISHLCRYSNADGQFLDGLLRRRLSEGLRLVGAKEPVVSMREYNALLDNARVHLGKPDAKANELAPLMVSYMLKHRLGEGKAHKAHQHERKDARHAGDNRR